jgi:hypothetical protein
MEREYPDIFWIYRVSRVDVTVLNDKGFGGFGRWTGVIQERYRLFFEEY